MPPTTDAVSDFEDEAWLAGDATAGLEGVLGGATHSADTLTRGVNALTDQMGLATPTAYQLASAAAELRDRSIEAGIAARAMYEALHVNERHAGFGAASDEAMQFGDVLGDRVVWSVNAVESAMEKLTETARETGSALRDTSLTAAEIARNQRQFSEWSPAYERVEEASRRLARARRSEIEASQDLERARSDLLAVEQRIADLSAPHTIAAGALRDQLRGLNLQEAQARLSRAQRRQQAQGDEDHLERIDDEFRTFQDQQRFQRDELDARLQIERIRIEEIEAQHQRDLEAAQQAVTDAQQKVQLEREHRADVIESLEDELELAEDQLALVEAQHELELADP